MSETIKEAQIRIDLENIARNRCYRRFSRIKFVTLTEEQRKEFMVNCIRAEVEKLRDKQKNNEAIEGRKTIEQIQRERGLERLAEIKMFKEYDEALKWTD